MPTLDFVADILCPWCFIARRRLESSIPQLRQQGLSIDWVWRPFLLDPNGPAQGRDAREHWQNRFGSLDAASRYHAQVAEAGRTVHIDFRYDLVRHIPHSRDLHRMILLAQEHDLQDRMCETLATAFFTRGLRIGDADVLVELAVDVGLQRVAARNVLVGSTYAFEVMQSDELAKRNGIHAVPAFCFYGKTLPIQHLDGIVDALLSARRSLGGVRPR